MESEQTPVDIQWHGKIIRTYGKLKVCVMITDECYSWGMYIYFMFK